MNSNPNPPTQPPGDVRPGLVPDAFLDSNPGRARDHNEDAIVGPPPNFPPLATRGYLYIVADGMGGHNAGEVASSQAARMIFERYYADQQPDIPRSLDMAIRSTNAELYRQAQSIPAQHGMGTTLTAAVIKDGRLYVAHVGDSRLYLIRGGKPEQVTTDHSWVAEQMRAGVLTPLQAETHPQRNVITRALATAPDVKVDSVLRDLQPGDTIVMCSDGLNTEVGDHQIASHATKGESPQEAVTRLIQLANDNGGEDNISVAVIRMREAAVSAAAPAERTTVRAVAVAASGAAAEAGVAQPRRRMGLIIGVVVVVLVLAAVGLLLARQSGILPGASPQPAGMVTSELAGSQTPPAPTATPAAGRPPEQGTALPVSLPSSGETPPAAQPVAAEQPGQPTVTLVPRSTKTPTPVPPPTRTPSAVGPTAVGPTPVAVAPSVYDLRAAPQLLTPEDNDLESGTVTFKWNGGPLSATEAYAVLVWKDGGAHEGGSGLALPTLYGACDKPPHQETSTSANLAGLPGVWEGSGIYKWTVVIVDTAKPEAVSRCAVISTQATPKRFTYAESSGSGSQSPRDSGH